MKKVLLTVVCSFCLIQSDICKARTIQELQQCPCVQEYIAKTQGNNALTPLNMNAMNSKKQRKALKKAQKQAKRINQEEYSSDYSGDYSFNNQNYNNGMSSTYGNGAYGTQTNSQRYNNSSPNNNYGNNSYGNGNNSYGNNGPRTGSGSNNYGVSSSYSPYNNQRGVSQGNSGIRTLNRSNSYSGISSYNGLNRNNNRNNNDSWKDNVAALDSSALLKANPVANQTKNSVVTNKVYALNTTLNTAVKPIETPVTINKTPIKSFTNSEKKAGKAEFKLNFGNSLLAQNSSYSFKELDKKKEKSISKKEEVNNRPKYRMNEADAKEFRKELEKYRQIFA